MTVASVWSVSISRKPIAACIATAFALAIPASALAATVTSCLDDGGPGTLRSVIAAAAEGGTVDFTGLNCTALSSKITLSGTPLTVARDSLTIDGTGATSFVTVDASNLPRGYVDSRVFTHTGTGTLSLKNLGVSGGYILHYSLPSSGGCIQSSANVSLTGVSVSSCVTTNNGTNYEALGGAIQALGDVTLDSSNVYASLLSGALGAKGGGIFANNVTLNASNVSQNQGSSSGGVARGGGIYTNGNLNNSGLSFVSYNNVNAHDDAAGGGTYVRGNFTNGNEFYGAYISHNSASSTNGTARGGGTSVFGNFDSAARSFIKYNGVSSNGNASGGGLYVAGSLTFYFGGVFGNTAGTPASTARGGGARVLGGATLKYTTVSGNHANNFGVGGGLHLAGDSVVRHSTISGNSAGGNIGGLDFVSNSPGARSLTIESSTISNNTTTGLIGGVYSNFGHVNAYNSTIAFNSGGNSTLSPGVHLQGPSTVLLQNTLISNNHVGTADDDLTVGVGVTFDPASSTNLIRATIVSFPPGSTTTGACPLLGQLRFNGGLTQTHALMSKSPAIDTGGPTGFGTSTDQRGGASVNGSVTYPRVSGPVADPSPTIDIGAFEVQQDDVIFDTDFEACNLLF